MGIKRKKNLQKTVNVFWVLILVIFHSQQLDKRRIYPLEFHRIVHFFLDFLSGLQAVEPGRIWSDHGAGPCPTVGLSPVCFCRRGGEQAVAQATALSHNLELHSCCVALRNKRRWGGPTDPQLKILMPLARDCNSLNTAIIHWIACL